jgi:hypothetical protein
MCAGVGSNCCKSKQATITNVNYGEYNMKSTCIHGVLNAGIVSIALLLSGPVSATVFAPTDGNVNIFNETLPGGTLLAMFDDTDTSFLGASLDIALSSDVITFTAGGDGIGDYTATNEAMAELNLAGSDRFILAIYSDGAWSGDTGVTVRGTNSYDVNFSNGSILQVDAAVVPVPAAVWLFGSGLLGLVGIARRKSRQAHA